MTVRIVTFDDNVASNTIPVPPPSMGGSAHIIVAPDGSNLTQRANLQFKGQVTVTDNGSSTTIVTSLGEANVQSDWNQTNTGADDYIENKPPTISTGQATKVAFLPATAGSDDQILEWKNNVLVSVTPGVSSVPQITFHYLEYDFATGFLTEKYAEDGEDFTIDASVEYQPGFIQNEFLLRDNGVLVYTG